VWGEVEGVGSEVLVVVAVGSEAIAVISIAIVSCCC
jgi:hypothetical protein